MRAEGRSPTREPPTLAAFRRSLTLPLPLTLAERLSLQRKTRTA
jgi:hypothetical protein